jgi:hypothetical protein
MIYLQAILHICFNPILLAIFFNKKAETSRPFPEKLVEPLLSTAIMYGFWILLNYLLCLLLGWEFGFSKFIGTDQPKTSLLPYYFGVYLILDRFLLQKLELGKTFKASLKLIIVLGYAISIYTLLVFYVLWLHQQ